MTNAFTHQVVDPAVGPHGRPREGSVFGFFGLRPVYAQHTREEEDLLRRYAAGKSSVVELGTAEGASAAVLRAAADPGGTVTLIDPYLPGRIPGLNLQLWIARRYVGAAGGARVEWIRRKSFDAVKRWSRPIDFLFIDGDHEYESVRRDWLDWTAHVAPDGVVALHDARVFPGGWVGPDWGPARVASEMISGTGDWRVVDGVHSLLISRRAGR